MGSLGSSRFEGVSDAIRKLHKSELQGWMVEYAVFWSIDDWAVDDPYSIVTSAVGFNVSAYVTTTNGKFIDLNKLSASEVREKYVGVYAADSRWHDFTNMRTSRHSVIELAQYFATAINEQNFITFKKNFPLDQFEKEVRRFVRNAILDNNQLFENGGDAPFKEVIRVDGLDKIKVVAVECEFFSIVDWKNLVKWRHRNYF